jgi:hypothetical protein
MTASGVGKVVWHLKKTGQKCASRLGVLLVVVCLLTALASAQAVDRIAGAVAAGGRVTLKGTAHPAARRYTDLGPLSPQMTLASLSLHTSLSTAQRKDMDSLLAAQQNPQSPLYHHWLTQEEYGARFGLSNNDLVAVTGWLQGQGFTIVSVSKSRNAIRFSGTVARIEAAFNTQLHRFQASDGQRFANTTDIQVPAALSSVLLHLRGLDNFRPKPMVRHNTKPAYTADTDPIYTYLSPGDWATIYDVTPIYTQTCGSNNCDGTGMHVGVVGQTYIYSSDIQNFRSASSLSTSNSYNYVCIYPSVTSPSSTVCKSSSAISTKGDLTEADLDIEWAGGIAKNATVDYLYAPYSELERADSNTPYGYYDVFDALGDAVSDYTVSGSVLPVISMSYTDCEADLAGDPTVGNGTGYVAWITDIGEQASLQGQTLLVAAGDSGAFSCDSDSESEAKDGVYVSVPDSSPYYTAVGGTTLAGDESDQSAYWNVSDPSSPNKPVTAATALQYIPETAWNDTGQADMSGLAAGGGGVSAYFAQPSWQVTVGQSLGVTSWRMVPDVSFAASPLNDGYLICSTDANSTAYGTTCGKGFWSSLGYIGENVIGGTSAGTPSFAGLLTLLVQKYGKLGNVNPTLYGLAASEANYTTTGTGSIFHVIGSSVTTNIPCVHNLTTDPGCPSSGSFGYAVSTSFPYYNMATGLGSIDGYELYTALGSSSVLSDSTSTSVGVSPTSIALGSSSATLSLNATVTGNGGTPAGTVTFKVGSVTIGTTALNSGAASISSVAPTSLNGLSSTLGSNTVTATFTPSSGSLYTASSGTTTVTTTAPAYTVTPSSTSISLSEGGSTSTTITLASTTYADTVQLKVTPSSSLITATLSSGTLTISNGAVTLPANTSGTVTLTITASSSATNHGPRLPWTSGVIAFGIILGGVPLAWRRKRVAAVLLTALVLSLMGFMVACGGGGSSSSGTSGPRSYTVVVSGSGGISNSIPVTVQ